MSKLDIEKVSSADDRKLPVFQEFEEIADRIRVRAFNLFSNRGYTEGHDLDDWLTAQREVCWPAAELIEKDDKFEVHVALAGFDSGDVTVTATPRELLVKASRKHDKRVDEDREGVKVRWSEFQSNDVYRQIDFPGSVEVEKIKADFQDGMLEIEAPKSRDQTGAQKEIKVSKSA